jgi:hypothetical protein
MTTRMNAESTLDTTHNPTAWWFARGKSVRSILTVTAALLLLPSMAASDPWPQIPIPPQNDANLRRAPARPGPGDASERAAHLVRALSGEDPGIADDFFLPREPFLAIKDMSGAARYYATLMRWYRRDIETYRSQIRGASNVSLVRFEPSQRCTWMSIGREANRLPYWSCYGSRLVVQADGRELTFRVHVLIHWGDQWYVTHLGPIPQR